jgi:hypothetical protein
MLKKFTAIIFSALIIIMTASCGDSPPPETSPAPVDNRITAEEAEVIDAPNEGWTLQSINKVLYIDGRKREVPFRFGDLGEDFTIPEVFDDESSERVSGTVYYKDKPVFSVTGQYTDTDKTLENSLIDTVIAIDEMNYSELSPETLVIINGIGIGSDAEDIKKQLGTVSFKEDISSASQYIYAVGETDNAVLVGVDTATEKVNAIWVVLSFEVNAEEEK